MVTSTKQRSSGARRAQGSDRGSTREQRSGDRSPGQRLMAEAEDYLAERARGLLGSLTERIADAGASLDAGGALGEVAKGLVGKENPVSAVAKGVGKAVGNKVGRRAGGSDGQKAVNIAERVDVGVPVKTAYNQWTQLTEFSRFTKGVQNVEQIDDVQTRWDVKIWWSSRSWTAKITEQVPDRRIAWTSEGSKGSVKGVVTFHELAPNLTRVLLEMEYYPKGFFEKTANLWRAQGRRTRLDLKHFRRFVTMHGEETGEWRGQIRDAEVVGDGTEEDRDQARDEQPGSRSARGARHDEERQQDGADEDRADEDRADEDRADDGADEDGGDEASASSGPRRRPAKAAQKGQSRGSRSRSERNEGRS